MTTTTGLREQIAAEVRAEMARQNLTQRQVADMIGMLQAPLQMRLSGQRPFRAEELVQLADALGVPVTKFIPDAVPARAA